MVDAIHPQQQTVKEGGVMIPQDLYATLPRAFQIGWESLAGPQQQQIVRASHSLLTNNEEEEKEDGPEDGQAERGVLVIVTDTVTDPDDDDAANAAADPNNNDAAAALAAAALAAAEAANEDDAVPPAQHPADNNIIIINNDDDANAAADPNNNDAAAALAAAALAAAALAAAEAANEDDAVPPAQHPAANNIIINNNDDNNAAGGEGGGRIAVIIPTPAEVELVYTYPQDFEGSRSWRGVFRRFGRGEHFFRLIIDPSCRKIPGDFFCHCSFLIDVVFAENSCLTEIGKHAFACCNQLQRMNALPVGLLRLGTRAFFWCRYLRGELVIPYTVVLVSTNCFLACNGLTSVVFHDNPTPATNPVLLGRCAFAYCSDLQSVRLPQSIVLIPRKIFYACTSLMDCPLPSSLLEIEDDAFFRCTSLPSVILPKRTMRIGARAYGECPSLVQVTIRTTEELHCGREVFTQCPALVRIQVYPSLWTTLFESMNADPSFLFYFIRKYQSWKWTNKAVTISPSAKDTRAATTAASNNNNNNNNNDSAMKASKTTTTNTTQEQQQQQQQPPLHDTIHLEVTTGPYAGKFYDLQPKARKYARIGRSEGRKFKTTGMSLPNDDEVSGSHGRFEYNTNDGNEGGVTFTYLDVGSTNGSRIDGDECEPNTSYILSSGMTLVIGTTTCKVTLLALA